MGATVRDLGLALGGMFSFWHGKRVGSLVQTNKQAGVVFPSFACGWLRGCLQQLDRQNNGCCGCLVLVANSTWASSDDDELERMIFPSKGGVKSCALTQVSAQVNAGRG